MIKQASKRNLGLKVLVALLSLAGAGAALAHPGSTEALAGIELVMHLAVEHVFWPLIVVLVVGGVLMRRRKEVSS